MIRLGLWLRGLLGATLVAYTLYAQTETKIDRYEVIPSSWISGAGRAPMPASGGTDAAAYIFPSLPADTASAPISVGCYPIPGFFDIHSHFRRLTHSTGSLIDGADIVAITVKRPDIDERTKADLCTNTHAIRKLSWPEFQEMQRKFAHWLCSNSDWIFQSCDNTLPELNENLLKWWTDKIIEGAKFVEFSIKYLRSEAPIPISYVDQSSSNGSPHWFSRYDDVSHPNETATDAGD